MDGFYEWDEDENQEYLNYLKYRAEEFEDETEREQFFKELQEIRFNPSNNPRQDAELNYRRAKDRLRKKSKVNNPHIKSYARFMQHEENLSDAEVKKRVREALKGSGE